jgi:cytochrome b subunit of formate dehydrogenase
MSEVNRPISVSEDRLRAIMAEFELRLRDFIEDKLVHKADLAQLTQLRKDFAKLEERVDDDVAGLGDRVNVLEKWRYALGLLATVALALAGLAAATNHL